MQKDNGKFYNLNLILKLVKIWKISQNKVNRQKVNCTLRKQKSEVPPQMREPVYIFPHPTSRNPQQKRCLIPASQAKDAEGSHDPADSGTWEDVPARKPMSAILNFIKRNQGGRPL